MSQFLIRLCAAALLVGAHAAYPASTACRAPRCEARSLIVGAVDYPYDVLLPSGYSSSTKHYPVLYLNHTAFTDQDQWLELSDIESFTAREDVIVVMPYQGPIGDLYSRENRYERFLLALIAEIDANYRTIPDRSQRAIAGVSGGAYHAVFHAARHPDLFTAVGGFSSAFYDFTEASPVVSGAVFSVLEAYTAYCAVARTGDPSGLCDWPNSSTDPTTLVGEPVYDDLYWHERSATDLAANLRSVSIYLASGNGVPCDEADVAELSPSDPFTAWEPISQHETIDLDDALARAAIDHTADLYGCGIHSVHSWRYYNRDLRAFWPQMRAAFGAASPSSFDFKQADSVFSVWGWTFGADPLRAAEFLYVSDASCAGVTLAGSGTTVVTTAACFVPGQRVELAGALVERSVIADEEGRIMFAVDLGRPHAHQQYTPAALVLEATDGYWTSRTVTFSMGG